MRFEKIQNNRPEIPNPLGDPKIREIKLFAPEKSISILVVPKQDFLVERSTTQSFSSPASQRNTVGLRITQIWVKPGG